MNIADYKFRTEMHAHTNPASGCSDVPPEDAVRLYAEAGYDSIVIANHFYKDIHFWGEDKEKCISEYLKDYELAKAAGEKYGVNVIFGCEIRFTENSRDYLLFGIDTDIMDFAYESIPNGLEAFSKTFRNDDTMIIHAHPYRSEVVELTPDLIDGLEVFNMHPHFNARISLVAKSAKDLDMIVTCGTDFHYYAFCGLTALLTRTPLKDSHDIVKVLKSRDYLIEIGGCIICPYGEL